MAASPVLALGFPGTATERLWRYISLGLSATSMDVVQTANEASAQFKQLSVVQLGGKRGRQRLQIARFLRGKFETNAATK